MLQNRRFLAPITEPVGSGGGWLNPKYTDAVNGTTVLWMLKPMDPEGPEQEDPKDLAEVYFKAFQIHKDYPNILVMPEQYQEDEADKPGGRLKTDRKKQKFLDDISGLFKNIYAGQSGKEVLDTLNGLQRLTSYPDYSYNPDKGYFNVKDPGGRPATRGNVVVLGPSERLMTGGEPAYHAAVPRTVPGGTPEVAIGAGSMVIFDPTFSVEVNDGEIMHPFTVLAHEFLHCLQIGLGISPKRNLFYVETPKSGMAKGEEVKVRKSESDVTSFYGRCLRNEGEPVSSEYKNIASKELDNILKRIEKSSVSEGKKTLYRTVVKNRREQCEKNIWTEDLITLDSYYARGLSAPEHKAVFRDFYSCVGEKYYETTNPEDPDNGVWTDTNRKVRSCAIM
ncbi:hypothetical protein [Mycobacteroides abscessus]|uniref:hypothetical protein n=1 Tax=Mycobacteroides abscessus TaxID=36809 RepID=UPI000C260C20|nr:hypothetical protein [Mycobacteroides abscessus]